MLGDIIQTLIVALSAIVGSILGTWFVAKKARKIRFDEIMAEKMVPVCQEASVKIHRVIGDLSQATLDDTLS